MEFREKQAIYLQIAEYVCEQILIEKTLTGDKVLSIRDLAVKLEVNPNTVQRTYDYLQQKEIIQTKRGMGYFVAEDAEQKIRTLRREQFIENDLPVFFKNVNLLNIGFDEIQTRFSDYILKLNEQ